MREGKEKTGTSWLPRVVMLLGLAAIALIALAVYKESGRKREVQSEIESLKAQADAIQKENAGLSEKISYLGSGDFQEKEAKDKLNLQKPGENLVVIQPEKAQDPVSDGQKETQQQVIVKVSNPEKWWDYLFKY